MPNIQIDTGTKRRIKVYTHKSIFVDKDDEVNEDKYFYKKDKTLKSKIRNGRLLNAFFDIVTEKCVLWYKGDINDLDENENFKDSKESFLSANDIFIDFIDSRIEITDNQDDRISKKNMHKEFHEMYEDKHLSVQQVISSLKDKGINYNGCWRCDNIRGCFTGVRFVDTIEREIDANAMMKREIMILKKGIQKRDDIIKSLKKQIEEPEVVNIIKMIKNETNEDDEIVLNINTGKVEEEQNDETDDKTDVNSAINFLFEF